MVKEWGESSDNIVGGGEYADDEKKEKLDTTHNNKCTHDHEPFQQLFPVVHSPGTNKYMLTFAMRSRIIYVMWSGRRVRWRVSITIN